MESAVTGRSGSRCAGGSRNGRLWIATGLLLGAGVALAEEPPQWASGTAAAFTPRPLAPESGVAPNSLIEISTSRLPHFDPVDGATRSQQRIDMALVTPGRPSFGVTMGIMGLSPSRHGVGRGGAEGLSGVNLGLQWRYIMDSNRRIDITAWRDIGRPNDALSMIHSRNTGPGYGARVEMQLPGPRSSFVAARGFIGLQLDGGARITIKRSGGRPMIYYRNKF